jgi:hypothetical protein
MKLGGVVNIEGGGGYKLIKSRQKIIIGNQRNDSFRKKGLYMAYKWVVLIINLMGLEGLKNVPLK